MAGTVTAWVKKHHPEIPVRSGNVVDGEAFTFLAKAGADFIEVGVGGSPICISRNQKGIGRGQASAVQDVAATRDAFRARTSAYADTLLHCHRLTDLRLAGVPKAVARVLEITGLHEALHLYPSVEAAQLPHPHASQAV
nr:IMP dehydrogenase [Streptomyces sp. SID14446]